MEETSHYFNNNALTARDLFQFILFKHDIVELDTWVVQASNIYRSVLVKI